MKSNQLLPFIYLLTHTGVMFSGCDDDGEYVYSILFFWNIRRRREEEDEEINNKNNKIQ